MDNETINQAGAAAVLLVEGQAMIRDILAHELSGEQDIYVAASVGTCQDAKGVLREMDVDVVIVDTSLQDGTGTELVKFVKSEFGHVKVIVLSSSESEDSLTAAVRAGADGFVVKSNSYEQLLADIRSVIMGQVVYDPAICSQALRRLVLGELDGGAKAGRRRDRRQRAISSGVPGGRIAGEGPVQQGDCIQAAHRDKHDQDPHQ